MWKISADVQSGIQMFHDLIVAVKNKPSCRRNRKRKNRKTKHKAPSPTPKSPVEYKVLSRVTVRGGKSLKSEIIGHIYKGTIVTVNQCKGRRARVVRNTNNGTMEIGWVSLHTSYSLQLLTQFFKPSLKSKLKGKRFLSKSSNVDAAKVMDEDDSYLICRNVIMLPLIE